MNKLIVNYLNAENEKTKDYLYLSSIIGCDNCNYSFKTNVIEIFYCKKCIELLCRLRTLSDKEILEKTGIDYVTNDTKMKLGSIKLKEAKN